MCLFAASFDFLADLQERIGLAPDAGPPALEVVRERAGADHAKAVTLGKGIDLDDDVRHGKVSPQRAQSSVAATKTKTTTDYTDDTDGSR